MTFIWCPENLKYPQLWGSTNKNYTEQYIFNPIISYLSVCSGGTLVFDEADIELQAENILITDGGKLQIGQEGAPFQHKAIITLHGSLRSPELPVYGTKTLAVREGVLDLHGKDTQLQLCFNR